jgi:hypothetical protein
VEHLGLCPATVLFVRNEYKAIPVENKPEQPVERLPLHIYRVGEETFIEEVWQDETVGQQQQPQQGGAAAAARRTVEENLARVPASGGSAATQQVLQTLLIQNQQ